MRGQDGGGAPPAVGNPCSVGEYACSSHPLLKGEEKTKSETKQEVAPWRASWGGAQPCARCGDRGQCPEKDGPFVLCGQPWAVWAPHNGFL